MSTKLNQKEYLKKYLSGGGEKKKKKKLRKSKHTSATVHIIDDDVHGDRNSEIDEELLLTGEDAPQIVGIIDASGSANGQSKWKSISGSKEERESEPRRSADDDLWGKKATSFGGDRSPIRRNPWRDQSPPRRVKERRSSDLSPPRRRNHSNGGELPARGRSPVSHSRRRDSDQSPPRRRQTRRDSDQSPPRRRGQPTRDERLPRDSDQSPPRRRSRARRESDQSPPRRRRDSDQSPARRRSPARRDLGAYRSRDSDQSLPRRRSPSRRDSGAGARRDSDQSPPRRRSPARRNSGAGLRRDSDQSGAQPPARRESGAPRKSRWGSEHSPSRKPPALQRADDDLSPVRVRRENPFNRSPPMNRSSRIDDDLSPVRVKRENPFNRSPVDRRVNGNPFKTPAIKKEKLSVDNSPRRHRPRASESPGRVKRERRSDSPPPTHKMTKTLDGKRAGLQNAQTLKLETEERRRNEDRMFSKMSAELSGRDAEVQVRQSSAYRRRRKEEDPEVQRKRAEHEQQKKELYDRWNKGLKQIEAYKAKISDDQYESSKPLARYSNDADLDEMLRQQERDDDPMLEYMRSKRKEHQKAASIPVMPRYKGSFPENRFNIPPGYRWDGVDRSNGYERKWFDVQNQKKALADEAYKYSTEDM